MYLGATYIVTPPIGDFRTSQVQFHYDIIFTIICRRDDRKLVLFALNSYPLAEIWRSNKSLWVNCGKFEEQILPEAVVSSLLPQLQEEGMAHGPPAHTRDMLRHKLDDFRRRVSAVMASRRCSNSLCRSASALPYTFSYSRALAP